MARSRGQQAYAEWLKEFKQAAQDFRDAQGTYIFTSDSLDRYLEQYILELEARFDDEELPNPDHWIERAREFKEELKDKLMTKYGIDEGDIGQVNEDDPYEQTTQGVEAFGLKILTQDEIDEAKAQGATRRATVFPSIADVIAYIEDVPASAIVGVEPIYDDFGTIEGFYIWLSGS